MGDYGRTSRPGPYYSQTVANESWPFKDSKGEHARGIPNHPPEACVLVEVRVVFATDGEFRLDARRGVDGRRSG